MLYIDDKEGSSFYLMQKQEELDECKMRQPWGRDWYSASFSRSILFSVVSISIEFLMDTWFGIRVPFIG